MRPVLSSLPGWRDAWDWDHFKSLPLSSLRLLLTAATATAYSNSLTNIEMPAASPIFVPRVSSVPLQMGTLTDINPHIDLGG